MDTTVTRSLRTTARQRDRGTRLDELFTAHAGDVYAFAARRASRTAADDVVAETFLVAWRRLDSIPEQALPWLLAVARRVLANQRRSAGRRQALTARLGASGASCESIAEERQSDHPEVLAALAGLSPHDRDAITLIAWDGLDAEQAATVLGCTRAAFYVRLHRARKRLAAALEDAQHPPHRPDDSNDDEQERDRS